MAKLLQPINEDNVSGMAEIYVAETLQSRRYLATQLLFSSLVSQGLLVLLTLVLTAAAARVLRPMRQLSSLMVRRELGCWPRCRNCCPVGNAAADRGF